MREEIRGRLSPKHATGLLPLLLLLGLLVLAQAPSLRAQERTLWVDDAEVLIQRPYQYTHALPDGRQLYAGTYSTPNARTQTFELGFADASGTPVQWTRQRSESNKRLTLWGFAADAQNNIYVLLGLSGNLELYYDEITKVRTTVDGGPGVNGDYGSYVIAKYNDNLELVWYHVAPYGKQLSLYPALHLHANQLYVRGQVSGDGDLNLRADGQDLRGLSDVGSSQFLSRYDLDFGYGQSVLISSALPSSLATVRTRQLGNRILAGMLVSPDASLPTYTVGGVSFGASPQTRGIAYQVLLDEMRVAQVYEDVEAPGIQALAAVMDAIGAVYLSSTNPGLTQSRVVSFGADGARTHELVANGRVTADVAVNGLLYVLAESPPSNWTLDKVATGQLYATGQVASTQTGVLALDKDLQPLHRGIFNFKALYETVAGKVGFVVDGLRESLVIEPGPNPYVASLATAPLNATIITGTLTAVCRSITAVELPQDTIVDCVEVLRWQVDVTAKSAATGVRYQWFDISGQAITDVGQPSDNFYVRGGATRRLIRETFLAEGYAGLQVYVEARDGCDASRVARDTALLAGLAPAKRASNSVREYKINPGIDTSLSFETLGNYPESLLDMQWYRGGFALENGGKYQGVQTRKLDIKALTHDDDGVYALVTDVPACNYDVDLRGAYLQHIRVLEPRLQLRNGGGVTELGVPFPNPTSTDYYLPNVSDDVLSGEVRVYNAMGRPMLSRQAIDVPAYESARIDVHGWPPGLYEVEVRLPDGRRVTHRMLITPPRA